MFGLFKKKAVLPPVNPVVDLARFTLDDLVLGEPVPQHSAYRDGFVPSKSDPTSLEYVNARSGVSINVSNGVVDSFFIHLGKFGGQLLLGGQPCGICHESSESAVAEVMGEPYWKDVDEYLEVIDFHEFDHGRVEIQFEYPAMCQLTFITILSPGVLSKQDQREAYRVTKPWPPSP